MTEPLTAAANPAAGASPVAGAHSATLSLTARLLLAATVLLFAFLGITGYALESAYQEGARQLIRDRMEAQVYALLSATDVDERGELRLPGGAPDPQLARPDSGTYAAITDRDGRMIWASPSLMGRPLDVPRAELPGEMNFTEAVPMGGDDGAKPVTLFGLAFTVDWMLEGSEGQRLNVLVAQNHAQYRSQLAAFRRSLWGWFALAAGGLLAAQGAVLSWSLHPVRRLVRQLNEVESGAREMLDARQPAELQPLVDALNALVRSGQHQIARYRNALGDLAHSLKTPLAVLRGAVDTPEGVAVDRAQIIEATARMNETVEYQLQRAAAAGRAGLARRVAVQPLAQRLANTLAKVHHARGLTIDIAVDPEQTCRADEGDLTELLGNLLDNACKWARTRVRLQAEVHGDWLALHIDDDGPGFGDEGQTGTLTGRGMRADSATPGHGIGLAIVRELVEDAYGGELHLGRSPLLGARVTVALPGAARRERDRRSLSERALFPGASLR